MNDTIPITKSGLVHLKAELKILITVDRLAIRKAIAEARAHGDLSENAEYHAAKEKLGEIMGRIAKIQDHLAGARLIEDLKIKKNEVQIGVKVTLKDEDGDEYEWTLVGAPESDPAKGRISVDSPLAQGLLGHKVGEKVKVDLPAGATTFKILKTTRGV